MLCRFSHGGAFAARAVRVTSPLTRLSAARHLRFAAVRVSCDAMLRMLRFDYDKSDG